MSHRALEFIFGVLAPKKEISRKQWLKILTYYLDRIKPHLKYVSLKSLGKHLFWLCPNQITLEDYIKEGVPHTKELSTLLKKQGLFFLIPKNNSHQTKKDHFKITRFFWGILRNHKIIIGTLLYDNKVYTENSEEKLTGTNKLLQISIKYETLENVLYYYKEPDNGTGASPSHLIWQLVNEITLFTDERYKLYNIMKKLDDDFKKISEILFYTSNYKITK